MLETEKKQETAANPVSIFQDHHDSNLYWLSILKPWRTKVGSLYLKILEMLDLS